jgi:hypothetical protein
VSGYTKLFASILDSTIWQEAAHTRLVWITMLAMADRDGIVEASVPGLAARAGVERAQCEEALAVLLAPDPDSRTPTAEGRRIERVPGGWLLINHELYRHRSSAEERREKEADRKRRARAVVRDVPICPPPSAMSAPSQIVPPSEAEAEAEAAPLSLAGVRDGAGHLGHLLSEYKRACGKAWADEGEILAVWAGGGLRVNAGRAQEAEAVLRWASRQRDPRAAISSALDGFASDTFARKAGRSMSLFAREPGRYLSAAEAAISSAPSDFSHVKPEAVPAWLRDQK